MTDKWTHAEAEALGKIPHDERLRMRLSERLECTWCGTDTAELRWTGYDTRMNDAQPCCEECYDAPVIGDGDPVSGKGYIDGPCFDDLPIAQEGVSK